MKKVTLSVLLVAGLGLGAMGSAFASDGTIRFQGSLVASTCDINGSSARPADVVVNLPQVSTSALNVAGQTAGRTPFALELTNCPAGVVSTYFEPGSTVTSTGRLNNQQPGGAANVDIQVLNDSYAPINLLNSANSQTVSTTSGAATLQYYAEYYANGPTSGGVVSTSITYSLIYP